MNTVCLDYNIEILNLQKIIKNQKKEIKKLKERLEGADYYIKTIEEENKSLKATLN